MVEILYMIALPGPVESGVYFEKIEPRKARRRLEYWFDGIHRFRLISSMRNVKSNFELPEWESRLSWGHKNRMKNAILLEDSDDDGIYD